MDKVSVATTDTVGITVGKIYQIVVKQSVNERGMPDTMKNGIKIQVMVKKPTGNTQENSINKYLPSEIP